MQSLLKWEHVHL